MTVCHLFLFFPVTTKATKFNPNCPITRFSLIDQIWTNFKTGVHHLSAIMEYGLTDHFPVIYVFQQYSSLVNKTIHFRKIAAAATENFAIKIRDSSFENVFNVDDCNIAFNNFYDELWKIYCESFPKRKKRLKRNQINAPWVTPKLRICIKKKYKMYNLLKRGLVTRKNFNTYKNMLVYVTRKIKKCYYVKKFYNCKDTKESWKLVNDISNRSI